MACLYINSKGIPWTKHSYSAGLDYDHCPYKYYLKRVLGWKERDDKAAFAFGRALEESIQYHHEHNAQGAIQDFENRWAVHKQKSLRYTDVEKDWDNCLQMGVDMLRLYIAVQPSLPIPIGGNSVFQREYAKEVFPNDPNYGGIEDAGKFDIVSYADPKHPLLVPIDVDYKLRPIIIDIKTLATEPPERQGMAAFDAQLRRYSWQSGIRDVGLLWFKKSNPVIKKNYVVSIIEGYGNLKPGQECVVAETDGDFVWVVESEFLVEQADKNKQNRAEFLANNGYRLPRSSVTKQRLQFNTGRVSEKSAEDAGKNAARQIIGIVNSWKTKSWPDTFGIRYPHDDRNDSYFRAFVMNDDVFRNHNFTKSDDFKDLFSDED